MDLKNLQIIVDNWIKEHGVRYFDELAPMWGVNDIFEFIKVFIEGLGSFSNVSS